MEPIRILHVVPNMQAGGLETFIMNVYRNMSRDKIQFDFLVHYEKRCFYDEEIIRLGGRIYRLSVREDNNFMKYLRDLNSFFKNHPEYEIVHGHMPTFGMFYFSVAGMYGVKTRICHSHTASSGDSMKGRLKKISGKTAKLFANHLFACSDSAGHYLFGKRPFTIIRNAIDIEKFSFNRQIRDDLRKRLRVADKLVIGHVGRFETEKNHVFLIKIFAEMQKKNKNSMLMLIGDGNLMREIKNLAWSIGLQDKVFFMGVRSDVFELYQAMDVFVLPSHFEALPIVTVEAQFAGLPVIVSDVVSNEARISMNFRRISLCEDASYWAEEILRLSENSGKNRVSVEISNPDYEIKHTVDKLTSFYQNHHRQAGKREWQHI